MSRKPSLFGRENPLLLAHRGYSKEAPENTLPAFALAKERGIPGVELDVHLCTTGEVVVIHDDSVDRTTNGTGRVEDLSWEQLRALDAGNWKDPKYAGTRIPLLSEVFALLGKSVIYDIEIKNKKFQAGPLERALYEEIRTANMDHRCLVSSFNPLSLRAFRKIARHIPVGIIYCDDAEVPPYLRVGQGLLFARCNFLKPEHLKVHRRYGFYFSTLLGYPFLPWTVDDPERGAELLKKGASGIISNDPGPLKPLFNLV